MASSEKNKSSKVKGKELFVSVFLLLLFWMIISLPHEVFNPHGLSSLFWHLVVGLPLAYLVTRMSHMPVFTKKEIKEHGLSNLFRLFYYLFYLMIQMIIAGFDVARRVMRFSAPDISPGVIIVNTPLTDDVQITLNANSITLTPGTITLDVEKHDNGSTLWVHSISRQGLDSIREDKGFVKKILNIYR